MTIGALTEQAFAGVIADVDFSGFTLPDDTLTIYTGVTSEEKEAPCVSVISQGVTDEAPNLGVFHVKLMVVVSTMRADLDGAIADNLAQKIFEAVTVSDIKTRLATKQPSLAVYDVFFVSSSSEISGDANHSALELEVICTQ